MDDYEELKNIDCNTVMKFSLKGMTYQAIVVSVYDGDTITVVFKFANKFYKWNCRINGIDTPEIKTKNIDEKAYAIKARDALRSKILGNIIQITCGDFDKYGRLLVDVIYCDENINKYMIDAGFAKIYTGGTKNEWEF